MKKLKLWGISLLAMFLMTGCGSGQNVQKYTSLVTLDINPSIQLQLDDDHKVVDAIAVNDDAKKVLEDMDLKQADANVALNALLGSLVKNGYLNANQNTVLLSVENDDETKRTALEEELSQYIYTTLQNYSIEGAIYSQNIDIDDDIENLMKKYSISYGKANLIEDIMDDDQTQKQYTVEDLVKLNAQDLILIHQSIDDDQNNQNMVGTVSTKQYISRDEALNIALKNASLTQDQIKNLEIDYDTENGVLTYDIEFQYNQSEYEYEVSATKGVVEREIEPEKSKASTSTKSKPKTNDDNTNYDTSNYGTSQPASTNQSSSSSQSSSSTKPSTSNSSSTNKNTNYDNTNYDNTNYNNSNYNSNQSSNSSTNTSSGSQNTNTGSQNSNYDQNSNYNQSSSNNQSSNYDQNSNYDSQQNSNYDDTNDNSNYDD